MTDDIGGLITVYIAAIALIFTGWSFYRLGKIIQSRPAPVVGVIAVLLARLL